MLGTSRRSLVGRVLIGDDTKAALNGAPCAVAVAPAGYSRQPSRLGSIGVGYDGSGESRHALEVARELSVQSGGKLEALEAVFVPARYVAGPVWPDAVTIEEMLAEARQRISEFADVEPHAVYGRPSEELALWSAGLDLLIVGSRGYGPVGRILHGSVAHELARTARCPLVVLNRAASVADASTALAAERTLRGSTVARRRRVSSSTELRDVRPRPTV